MHSHSAASCVGWKGAPRANHVLVKTPLPPAFFGEAGFWYLYLDTGDGLLYNYGLRWGAGILRGSWRVERPEADGYAAMGALWGERVLSLIIVYGIVYRIGLNRLPVK